MRATKWALIPCLAILVACNNNYRPDRYYDTEAKEYSGLITSKIEIDRAEVDKRHFQSRSRNRIKQQEAFLFGPLVYLTELKHFKGTGYQYDVKLNDGSDIVIIHSHPSFQVGDCVVIFISKDTVRNPPRMAFGGDCQDSKKSAEK